MPEPKLANKDVKEIQRLLKEGYKPKDLAQKYGVSRSVIYRRAKNPYQAIGIPLETKNKVISAIKHGFTKAEAAQLYGLNIGTVCNFTRELKINGHRCQGYHIIRKNGIELLRRLMQDG